MLKLEYTVHGVFAQSIERQVETEDGAGTLTIKGKRYELVSEREQQGTVSFFLSDGEADKAGLDVEKGDTVAITIRKQEQSQ